PSSGCIMTTDADRLTVVTAASPTRKRVISIVSHALLIIASILMLYPLLWLLAASFRPENEIFTSGISILPSVNWNLESYARGWNGLRVSFGQLFVNSFIISGLSVIGNVVACSLAAYAFA